LANYEDNDSDNDGIEDSVEAGNLFSDFDSDGVDDRYDSDFSPGDDSNANGLLDEYEAAGLVDTDFDLVEVIATVIQFLIISIRIPTMMVFRISRNRAPAARTLMMMESMIVSMWIAQVG